MKICYLDGRFLPENEALIPVTDRGFLFGDGLYVTIQVRDGFPLFLDDQLRRLTENCRSFRIIPPEVSREAIFELIEKNEAKSGVYKLQLFVTGGEDATRGLPPRTFGHFLMKITPFQLPPKRPLDCLFYPYPIATPHSHVKSLAHLNRYFVADYARLLGMDDAVTRTERGMLLEASFANLFWIVDGVLYTPSRELPLHFGVTIEKVLSFAPALSLETREVRACFEEISPKARLYRVSSMAGIKAVRRLDERLFFVDEEEERRLGEKLEELERAVAP